MELQNVNITELHKKLIHYAFVVFDLKNQTPEEQVRLLKSLAKELGDTADFLKKLA